MNYEEFVEQTEEVGKLPDEEQKAFYKQWLEKTHEKSEIRVLASFQYGALFYREGDFRKTIEIIEPIVVDYQSYPYTPKLLSCFNLMGVATHCETEYSISRFFYETALRVARENGAAFYYAFEYNNIALTYIAQQNYEEAIKSIECAEAVLSDCDEEMGAYIYINKSISYQKLEQLPEALRAFETGVDQYHADEIIPDDVIRCAATLYFRLGQKEKYENCKDQILRKISGMYAAEFMDACRELFQCGMDSDDDGLMVHILHLMDQYMEKYPKEIRVGLAFAELKYLYAVKKADKDAILEALEAKNDCMEQIIQYSEKERIKSVKQFIEINSQILDLEQDALTGFRNRKAYYKDIRRIEQEEEIRKRSVGVVFADVNGLKEINDGMGHEAGDRIISTVAKKIAAVFPEARKYRFGGDEFVVLSFDRDKAVFQEKLKRLAGQWDSRYSAFVGSVWLEQAGDFEKSVAVADARMYRDKSRYYEAKKHEGRRNLHIETEESLKKIAMAADLLPGGFFIYHADEKEELISFNQELLRIFKCKDAKEFRELTGNSFQGMVHPDDLAFIEGNISSQIKQKNDIDYVQYRIICRDGTVKQVLDYGRFVQTEKYGDVYYVFMNDIA